MSENNYICTREVEQSIEKLYHTGEDAIPEVVNTLIREGAERNASDLHINPESDGLRVKFRLDGVLQDFIKLPERFQENIVARLKVMAGLITYRNDIPQEGAGRDKKFGDNIEYRISVFPTHFGEKVSIRIFGARTSLKKLDELGLEPQVRDILEGTLTQPEGLLFLSGPCGSGKTTTLYSCLQYIIEKSSGGRNVVSVEDPVENEVPGVTQTSIKLSAGLNYATALRSLLRQDPEVIMVGEVRDPETAHTSVEAALTGHLVISTVHAARAALVPVRLLDMNVEPYALAATLQMVITQRLCRLLCEDCRRPISEDDNVFLYGKPLTGSFRAVGCERCLNTGFNGRLLLSEYLAKTPQLYDAIMKRAGREEFFHIAKQDGYGLEQVALSAVIAGRTSAEEVNRVLAGSDCVL